MRRRLNWILALGALLACAIPPAPLFAQSAAPVPPVPAGMGRIYFYRDYEPYESLGRPPIYLNGQTVGISIPGGTFYRDVAPGTYRVTVFTNYDFYPNLIYSEGPTEAPITAGETRYFKVESLQSWTERKGFSRDTFVVALIDPRQAVRELLRMRYLPIESAAF
jgi:Protein of unknown function (DUF2846)